MGIQIVQSLPEDEWRRFVDEHPAGNIFHTPDMFRVFERARGHEPTLWAAVNSSGPLALLLPVQITIFNGLLRRFTTRAVAYGGLLWDPSPKGLEALSVLLKTYRHEAQGAGLFTELRNQSDLGEARPLLNENGFAYEDHLNYLIDLKRSPEAILQSFSRKKRQQIRTGLKRGKVSIEEVDSPDGVEIFYRLLTRTYAAVKVPVADRSLFQTAFDMLHPKGLVKFMTARVGEDYAAGLLSFTYKGRIYAWYHGMDRTFGHDFPNELLLWECFLWGNREGYEVFDFGGAGKPAEEYGVRGFKAKFHGRQVNFGRNICYHAPLLLRLSKLGYSLYRRFI